ncbi:PAS domain S-box protein [Methanocella arvoryzae]|uniref:histidine kinase n=1 Tax=Methanocella arvoryzae (strain DSM 22066 / NBRC 105507 / MRE50) TaxID=351160 RepID=Q0W6T0_METAR|nr:PAS domain S-box protein [Methanocella arvoryzae]CAJ35913.1 putative signal transduction histidine kinase [Methanocella arvoryzae MRE50]
MSTRGNPAGADIRPVWALMAQYRQYLIVALILVCIAIALHFNLVYGIETVYTHFFYLPIILAAIWYYRKAVFLALFLAGLHIYLGIEATGSIVPSTIIRAIMFVAVAAVIGTLSGAREELFESVRKSEERLRSIFNGVSDAIFIHRLDGSIIEVNDRMLQMYGVTEGEARRLSIKQDYSSPANPLDELDRVWKRVISGDDQIFEWLARRPHDGFTFPVEVYLRKIRLGENDVILATVRDISIRKRAEEERNRLAENLRLLLESTDEGIYGIDTMGRITFINRSAAEMLGYGAEELIGLDAHGLAHSKYPDGSPFPAEACPIQKSVKTGEGVRVSDEVYWRHDGTCFPVEYSSTPIREEDKITGAVVIFYDITARKRTERELHDAKTRAELYVDLLGHDINNLNQQGIGYLEVAMDTLDLDEDSSNTLRRALDAMKNSSALIQNVRKIQQIEAEKHLHEIIDLGQLLSTVAATFTDVPGRKVTINYQPVTACCVNASVLIKEAFYNLVSNAVRHSTGPVTIWIKVSETEDRGKRFYRVDVEDTGPGIPDELKKKLFSRKVRGTSRTAGTGLGLFLVKSLVDDAGGSVWVEDRIPGNHTHGSRFVVMLPKHGDQRSHA